MSLLELNLKVRLVRSFFNQLSQWQLHLKDHLIIS
jgi:hypothetical protein